MAHANLDSADKRIVQLTQVVRKGSSLVNPNCKVLRELHYDDDTHRFSNWAREACERKGNRTSVSIRRQVAGFMRYPRKTPQSATDRL
jgi:hypothetical protein